MGPDRYLEDINNDFQELESFDFFINEFAKLPSHYFKISFNLCRNFDLTIFNESPFSVL